MDTTIKAVYKMFVYEDGRVELQPQPLDYIFDDLKMPIAFAPANISERIRQIMCVIAEVCEQVAKKNLWLSLSLPVINKQVSASYKKVAAENAIAEQTVADKCGRQLGLDKSGFVALVFDYLVTIGMYGGDYQESDLYKIIIQNASTSNDFSYISKSFSQLQNQ